MKIETITYKRVKNLGNFQSETMEVTAVLDQYDEPDRVSEQLRELVKNQLFPPTPAPISTESAETDNF
ncbi:hypothetical protein CDG76_20730 [Nostoc sp. 'Peltigera membranacea cyanobiont' 210A]|uniref:hypothetical protein n=1 Tax=Nostoc sp. 'Peltigera membranacea cyanobiont' 210A TaxID=2014529 RepID=UPI000B95B8AB|nr:hypothetical protein [Nostoc sp. 'Peltigera membranacea cyanobiont' 210A]OYD93121.1 hypothetical protein CDG76_20730 [Nostoc sp. 'Peltigera membranacea cyanobiont' 210A]